jgi:subtilisin family serine protease
MQKISLAIAVAIMSLATAATAHATSYVVTAKSKTFDSKFEHRLQAAGATITARLPQIGVAIVEADADFGSRASRLSGVRSAVPDVVIQFDLEGGREELDADYANPPYSGDDDAFFDLQWGHAAIDAAGAWNAGYRGAGATVAVLDSGIYCQHLDITPNLLAPLSASFVPGEAYCNTSGSSHGTHTSGTVLAADNGIGTIGVAPEAKLIAVKVLSAASGSGSFGGIIQGIVYAADAGADVINMSLGVGGGLPVGGKEVAELINATARATRYAYAKDVTVVASAGNDGRDLDHDSGKVCDTDGVCTTDNLRAFPAQLPGVLAVSALGPVGWLKDPANPDFDILASYSNYGQSAIDFAAPGGNFDYPGEENCTLKGITRPCWVFDMVISSTSGVASYGWSAGTSMAAPHVSGVAALIIGKHGGSLAPSEVERILRASADDLGKPGNDDAYGAGRVNAARAVQY